MKANELLLNMQNPGSRESDYNLRKVQLFVAAKLTITGFNGHYSYCETILNDDYNCRYRDDYHCPYRMYGDAVARTGGCVAYAHDNSGVLRILRGKMRLLKW